MKEFTYLGGSIALGILLWYAHGVWTKKIPASSPASFLMWTIMDSILLATTLAAHGSGWLSGAWTLGAGSVTVALFARGKWSWSYKETICAIGAASAMYAWFEWSAVTGLLAGIVAMNIAGVPIWIDLWRNPIRASWPVWFFTAVACLSTIFGSEKTLVGMALPASSMFFNGLVACVVLFKKPTT